MVNSSVTKVGAAGVTSTLNVKLPATTFDTLLIMIPGGVFKTVTLTVPLNAQLDIAETCVTLQPKSVELNCKVNGCCPNKLSVKLIIVKNVIVKVFIFI